MSRRMIATVVGVLFVVQMLTYMVGAASIQGFVDGATEAPPTLGVVLTMSSGVAIVAIGVLMYQVLQHVDRRLALWYLVLRVVELTVSASGTVYLLTQQQVVPNQHLWVYIPTAVGGLVLTSLLYVSRLVPRAIAVLGLTGYGSLLLGVPLDLLGVLDLDAGLGLVLFAPGALFELVLFPVWLIAKGFSAPAPAASIRSSTLATTG